MQNKYKLPDYLKLNALAIVKSYKSYRKEIEDEENGIFSFGSGHYETIGQERVYLPSGKGGKSSPTEDQAMRLEKLHTSYPYKCVQAVDSALDSVLKNYTRTHSEKIRAALIRSCECGRTFNFDYSGIDGLSRASFYRLKNQFLYQICKKMHFF